MWAPLPSATMPGGQGPVSAPICGRCGGSGNCLSPIQFIGVNFGAAVEGANTEFVRGQTNAQYFARRSSQLGLVVAAESYVRTKRLVEGEDIDLSTCLVIDPSD